jgi:S-DNA-T family DNA segregation ATPase FtsK/SpoIIIE
LSQQLTEKGTHKPSRVFELITIIILTISVFSMVCLLSDAAGIIGGWLSRFMRFWFGQLAIIPPILAIVFSLYTLIFYGRSISRRKLAGGVIAGIMVILLTHMYFGQVIGFKDILKYSSDRPGAGIIGAVLYSMLLKAFGITGCYVILSCLAVIAFVLYVDMPLNKLIKVIFSFFGRLIKGLWLALGDLFRGLISEVKDLFYYAKDAWSLRKHSETAAAKAWESTADTKRPRAVKNLSKKVTPNQNQDIAFDESEPIEGEQTDTITSSTENVEVAKKAKTTNRAAKKTANESFDLSQVPAASAGGTATFRLPPIALLERSKDVKSRSSRIDQTQLLEDALMRFNIEAKVVNVSYGPVVTRYELQPAPGVKVRQITSLTDDLALALAAASIRIEAPVPGKSVVGIEVANKETGMVLFREVVESEEFQRAESKLSIALGKDISGAPIVTDLRKMLHVLVAGATGSGKSVCINCITSSILYKAQPYEVKLLMIDPKRVELQVYDGIPHLVAPVVTDPKEAAMALRWAVKEMEKRYNLFSAAGVRNIDSYNRKVVTGAVLQEGSEEVVQPLPLIVVIIDELADLMMVAQHDVEDSICRLAQMARAAGIHLIIATQRPSVDVITGLIKANVPSRISFAVASSHDSRTILDMVGAERLLGKGDMLYHPFGANKPQRVQGALISDKEVMDVVNYWKSQGNPEYCNDILTVEEISEETAEVDDELYEDAVRLVVQNDSASISMLQRRFRIGYSRAARLIDMMEINGIVGPYQGSKPREVLANLPKEFDSED